MPMQTGKSALFGKLGTRLAAAHEKHKADETTYGVIELPAGIENGVAQLVECGFDIVKPGKENAGQYYFRATGIVHEPKDHEGVSVEGLRTTIMEMVCDTPKSEGRKTVEEHVAWIYNELRKLGVDTSKISYTNLETVCAALAQTKPFFRFRTWKGKKQTTGKYAGQEPRTNHQWNGLVDYSPGIDPSSNGVQDSSPQATAISQSSTYAAPETFPDAGQQPEIDPSEAFDQLVAAAMANDATAAKQLADMARECGYADADIEGAADWSAVGLMIQNAAVGGDAAAPPPAEAGPQTGTVYGYKMINPKSKQEVLIQVEITSVDPAAKVVNAKRLDNPKIPLKGISWDKLVPLS